MSEPLRRCPPVWVENFPLTLPEVLRRELAFKGRGGALAVDTQYFEA